MTAERENCASRRALLTGAPALALAASGTIAGTVAASVEPSELSRLIAAHRRAKAVYDAATEHVDSLDGTFVPLDPDTVIRGFNGGYSFKLGRKEVLALLEKQTAETIDIARRSYVTRFMPKAEHAKAIAKMERIRDRRLAEARAIFDGERARYAASGVGAAEKAETEASAIEDAALHAVLWCPCRTLAEVAEKAAYLRATWIASMPQEEHMVALLQSMVDAGGANV